MRSRINIPADAPQYLLEGALYALEQGGLLLRDALLLYKNQRYASAIVMALFAREEMGRYKLLRDLRKKMVQKGQIVTIEGIENACRNHVTKQLRGQFGVTLKSSGGDQIGKLMRAKLDLHPQSPEAHKANAQLDIIAKQLHSKMPQQRHDLRQESIYVGPSDSGESWNRPKDQSKQTAREELEGATNAYAGALDRLNAGPYRAEDPDFYSALEAWDERPAMPPIEEPPTPW